MDNSIRLPTGHRIGVDGLIGLIPGIGDVAGAAISSYFLVQAARLKVPGTVMARMAGNIVVETVLGAIPVLGDLFDLTYKANARNYRLLENFLDTPQRVRSRSNVMVGASLVAVLAIIGLVLVGAVVLVRAVWGALFT